uniref:Uncharacterized protein n=1 Tax=Arundo donax TaxID=35708 RepID=A0A0A9AH49_ARUDO
MSSNNGQMSYMVYEIVGLVIILLDFVSGSKTNIHGHVYMTKQYSLWSSIQRNAVFYQPKKMNAWEIGILQNVCVLQNA